MSENTITLYPSNWLYNAGVGGLLNVQEASKELFEESLAKDGSYNLPITYFDSIKIEKKLISKAVINLVNYLVTDKELNDWLIGDEKGESTKTKKGKKKKADGKKKESNLVKYQHYKDELGDFGYRFIRAGNKLFASKTPYQNLVQLSEWQSLEYADFVKKIPDLLKIENQDKCKLCHTHPTAITDNNSKLQTRLIKLQSTHLKGLGPSLGEFPNSFWNMKQSMDICPLCSFLIIHHHLALIKLLGYSEIFINAPSFKVMYELNKIFKEAYGSSNSEEARSKREILATTVIEYARKLQSTLGLWTGMNIEIVTKSKEGIDFFSLPYDVTKIISDRKIASVLSDLGEFKILNKVLDRKYADLIDISCKLLRLSTKSYSERNKSEESLVRYLLFRFDNQKDLTKTANKILKLYSLIEEKNKRS